jgi:hypothetical protein
MNCNTAECSTSSPPGRSARPISADGWLRFVVSPVNVTQVALLNAQNANARRLKDLRARENLRGVQTLILIVARSANEWILTINTEI